MARGGLYSSYALATVSNQPIQNYIIRSFVHPFCGIPTHSHPGLSASREQVSKEPALICVELVFLGSSRHTITAERAECKTRVQPGAKWGPSGARGQLGNIYAGGLIPLNSQMQRQYSRPHSEPGKSGPASSLWGSLRSSKGRWVE